MEAMLFSRLLPKSVRNAMPTFSQRADELITATSNDAKEASKQARLQLSAVGLPGSLEVSNWRSSCRVPTTSDRLSRACEPCGVVVISCSRTRARGITRDQPRGEDSGLERDIFRP